MRKVFFLPFIIAVFFSRPVFAQAQDESITITTYYPSPYGVYRQMQTQTLGVGDIDGDGYINSNDVPPVTSPGDVWIAGHVGIGTTTPSYLLDVNGTAPSGIRYTRSNARDARITVGDRSQGWSMASGWASDGDFSIIQEGVAGNRLYIKRNGNVGIGTTNPQAKASGNGYLDVKDVWVRDAGGGGAWISERRIIGTFEDFHEEKTGAYKGCNFAWGAAYCAAGGGGCSAGTRRRLMTAHDKVGAGELSSGFIGNVHVNLYGCVQE